MPFLPPVFLVVSVVTNWTKRIFGNDIPCFIMVLDTGWCIYAIWPCFTMVEDIVRHIYTDMALFCNGGRYCLVHI